MRIGRSVLLFIVAARGGVDGNAYHDLVANESKENMVKMQQLIDDKVPGINESRGQGGQTPLMMGCLMGKYNAVEKLLKAGADYTISEKDGYTPMHGCAFQGRADVCKLLIDFGLDRACGFFDGFTPIHRVLGRYANAHGGGEGIPRGGRRPGGAANKGRQAGAAVY